MIRMNPPHAIGAARCIALILFFLPLSGCHRLDGEWQGAVPREGSLSLYLEERDGDVKGLYVVTPPKDMARARRRTGKVTGLIKAGAVRLELTEDESSDLIVLVGVLEKSTMRVRKADSSDEEDPKAFVVLAHR